MSAPIRADLCVIGGGAAGLSVAAGAAQLGARVVLIERGPMGGECLNTGCVPSKALLAAAHMAHAPARSEAFGVTLGPATVDHAAVRAHVRGVIDGIAPTDSVERFEGLGVRVLRADARFTSPRTIAAGDHLIAAGHMVIATGSVPRIPALPGLAGLAGLAYLTHETLFDLPALPSHLLILGGGPIGMEMAQAHVRLGARVTVLEAAEILAREDREAAALVRAALRADGVELVEGVTLAAATPAPGGVALAASDGRRWTGTHVLVAAGRTPRIEGLDLAAAGIDAGPEGIRVDRGLRTTNRRVFAIGDVTGPPQFTHRAGWQAGLVIRAALFRLPVRADRTPLPRITFTDPELAQIGPTEAEARARWGAGVEVLRWSFDEIDRARAERRTEGFVKLMVRRGRPVGATVVGAGAGDILQGLGLAIAARMPIGALAGQIVAYPTRAEIGKRAAGQYYVPRLFQSPIVRQVVRLLSYI